MRYLSFLFLAILFAACQPNTSSTDQETTESTVFQVDLSQQAAWEKDHLRLIPITASAEFIASQEKVAQYTVLGEALKNERFRISEKKPFGRFDDSGAVNSLTVQNKTEESVLLMAGDVVQGGNQDRVIGEDRVIAARSIDDIPVFCVEKGRWTYEGDHALNEGDKKIFAFRGYYNVASKEIRKSVRKGNQNAVWDNVTAITTQQNASSETNAYAGLEGNDDFVTKRIGYERFFSDKLMDNTSIVGFIAISGSHIIGADVMGHPTLLNKQFGALLSSYATDAIVSENKSELSDQQLQRLTAKVLANLAAKEQGFYSDGQLVHYVYLP